MVPSTVAAVLLPKATKRLLRAAPRTAGASNKLAYHSKEKPRSGNESEVFEFKENMNRMAIGR
jgi:hypothetical protein